MDDETEHEDRPIEHIIIALSCAIQLRQSKIILEELLFLNEALKKELKKYERDIH
jgi:hypothetical protein